jgi:hypothetical protein
MLLDDPKITREILAVHQAAPGTTGMIRSRASSAA